MVTAYKGETSLTHIEHEIQSLESRFENFYKLRGEKGLWRQAVQRTLPSAIPGSLAVKQDGIEYQGADLEKAIEDHVAVLKLNPPQFSYYVPGTTKASRDLERDHLLAKTAWWIRDINPQRRWETRVYEGLVRDGLKIEWLRSRELPGMEEQEDLDTCPNRMHNTLLDGQYWTDEGDTGDADCHYYKYSVPVYGSDIQNQDGDKLTLNEDNKVGWIGADENHDWSSTNTKKIDVIVRDSRDLIGICPLKGCDHPLRRITIYACPQGGKLATDAEQVDSYQSPFPGSSFFIIGGHMFLTERDPDKIYRPLMGPMYYLQDWLNLLITWHAVLAFQEADDSQLYGNASQAKPENLSLLTGEDGPSNTAKLPDTGPNELPVYGFSIDRLPKKTSTEVMTLITRCLEMMVEFKPNRFQVGLNYGEASNATASANLAALQQSGIIYSPLLDEVAGAINKWDSYTDHQIRWYSYIEPDNAKTRYYATVSGDMATKRGESVYLDEKKCSTPHDLVVTIENLTWAERQAKWYLSYAQFQAGVKTVDDLIKDSGVFDVEAQKRMLEGDKVRQSLAPMFTRMLDLYLVKEASVNTGTDFGQLLQQTVPQQGQPGQPPPQDHNTAAANVARTEVQLPPMTQPSGGSPA